MKKTYLLAVLIIFSAFVFSLFFFGKNNIPFQNKVSAAGTCDPLNADNTVNHCRPLNRGCEESEVPSTTPNADCSQYLNIPSPNEKAVCCKMKTFSVTPSPITIKCPTIGSDGYINYCIPEAKGTCASNGYTSTTSEGDAACKGYLYGTAAHCCKTTYKIIVTPGAGSTPGVSTGGSYKLSGRVYWDNNKNSQYDSGDKAESGVKLELTNTGSATTDASGQYSFTGVTSGTHTLTGNVKEGSSADIPLTKTINITADKTGEDFVIRKDPLTGTVTGSGVATPTPTGSSSTSVDIQGIINSVSETKIKEYLTNLVDDDNTPGVDELQSRWSTYDGNGGRHNGNKVESEYIKNHFSSLGLESFFQPFTVGGVGANNVIARLPGTNINDTYLVVAHYDSRGDSNTGGSNINAPGADDNGTGTAVVMEAARVLKASGVTFKSSLEFIAFSGEEQDLYGSRRYVSALSSGKIIKGVINIDMVGNKAGSDCVKFLYGGGGLGSALSSKIIDTNSQYTIGLTASSGVSTAPNSDHAPFQAAGKPAIMAAECAFSPAYHSPSDKTTLPSFSFSQVTKTAKSVIGALASLASE